MNKKQQREFIKSICDNLKKTLLEKAAMIPENWDGIELRTWIGDIYKESFCFRSVELFKGKRLKDYRNDRMINPNL